MFLFRSPHQQVYDLPGTLEGANVVWSERDASLHGVGLVLGAVSEVDPSDGLVLVGLLLHLEGTREGLCECSDRSRLEESKRTRTDCPRFPKI